MPEVAKLNAEKLEATNIKFIKSDVFSGVLKYKEFDLIVSNPPYIPQEEYENLQAGHITQNEKCRFVIQPDISTL